MKNASREGGARVRVLDVAHPPLRPDAVEDLLMREWGIVRNSAQWRVIKVIHGYGSSGRGGSTRDTVRNWSSRMRGKILAVIAGEDYSMFHPESQAMRRAVGAVDDSELDAGNKGITYLWVR